MDPFVVRPPFETEVVAIPGDGSTLGMPLRDGLVVGSSPECTLTLDDASVRARHLYFDVVPDRVTVQAFDRSGFMVRKKVDERSISHVLRLGETIVVGEIPLLFQHRLAAPPWYEDARELLDRIREDPDDDAPRLVLADWLADRDPVRSEFIACQIAAEQGSAAAASRAEQLACLELAAPLAVPVVELRFRRGFVASVRILEQHDRAPLLDAHPDCAVTTLSFPPRPHLR